MLFEKARDVALVIMLIIVCIFFAFVFFIK